MFTYTLSDVAKYLLYSISVLLIRNFYIFMVVQGLLFNVIFQRLLLNISDLIISSLITLFFGRPHYA